jgi:oxygen-dependent protoporphyrinogen oxidase
MGGVLHPEMLDREDRDLIAIAKRELAELVGAAGELIETHVARWRNSMPQYDVGHLQLVAEIETFTRKHAGLELTGSGYRGVGIPQCVHHGRAAAERLAEVLPARHD